eukprot:1823656-Pleurochrysis_carterae.AAC.2
MSPDRIPVSRQLGSKRWIQKRLRARAQFDAPDSARIGVVVAVTRQRDREHYQRLGVATRARGLPAADEAGAVTLSARCQRSALHGALRVRVVVRTVESTRASVSPEATAPTASERTSSALLRLEALTAKLPPLDGCRSACFVVCILTECAPRESIALVVRRAWKHVAQWRSRIATSCADQGSCIRNATCPRDEDLAGKSASEDRM